MIPTALHRLRSGRIRQDLAISLAGLCLVMQFMVALFVAPTVQHLEGDDGTVTIVLCNLQGDAYTTLSIPDLADDNPPLCPALMLDHITSTGALIAVDDDATTALHERYGVAQAPFTTAQNRRYPHFVGRAPPVV